MLKHLLFDGPWTINSLLLQLFPWLENFQIAFEELAYTISSLSFDKGTCWIQLPLTLATSWWLMSTLIQSFKRSLQGSVEVDLSQPLKRGQRIGNNEQRVFMVTLYKKLPIYCFHFRTMRHGATNYTAWLSNSLNGISPPADLESVGRRTTKTSNQMDRVEQCSSTSPYSIAPTSCMENGRTYMMTSALRWWWLAAWGEVATRDQLEPHNLLEIFHRTTHGMLPMLATCHKKE